MIFFAGVGVVDGLLYAVGGHDGPMVRKSVEVYNPELNQWTQVADMTLCRRNAGWYYSRDNAYTSSFLRPAM